MRFEYRQGSVQTAGSSNTKRSVLTGISKFILGTVAGVLTAAATSAGAADLGGKEIVAETEYTYPPIQFIHPKTGDAIGWDYDAITEIGKRIKASSLVSVLRVADITQLRKVYAAGSFRFLETFNTLPFSIWF